ncbi:MAG: PKD domain-containing protein [Bacteroidetes bacterium]|nr:MAG: PKD domain-containing protein [Bacteroidota bacterium]
MSFHLNKFLPVLVTVLLWGFNPKGSKASHSMGADLTYRCLGGNTYEITLSFYRDCAGVPADQTANIAFTSSCFPAGFATLSLIPGTGQEITPLCPSQVSTCNGGTFTGIQEYIYRGTVTLPGPCADWTMSYNLCCRNAAITNIDFPSSTQIYVFATLNNLITPCNNSPTFSNLPVPFVCLGQQYCYNHGAYDIDGDSLVYEVITPYDSPGLPVQYNGTFSPNNPLSSSPGMTFNSATGDICMTPTSLEITVMAVLVKEYRNGVLIGSVERDIQVTVIDCNNQLPALTGINGTNSFATSVCAGTQLCFNIQSSDPNASQNTTISWDQSIPDATFTVNPGNRQSASFCWTPSASDISSNPYCFTVLVQDDNCPFLGSQVYSYCVTVRGLAVNAGPNVSVGCNSNSTITASASGGNGNYTYSWSNGATGPTISASPGTYIVTASDGTCSTKDTVQVLAGTNTPAAAFTMLYSCSGLNVQFTNQSTIVGGTISSYTWDFGDGNSVSGTSPSHTYAAVGTYQVMLIAQAVGGCVDTTIQTLNLVNDQPDALFNLNDACVGSQVNFSNQSNSISAITGYTWDFGDASGSNVPNPAHVYNTVGSYNIKLVIVNANGCTDSITQAVTIFPLPIPNAGNDVTLCAGETANLTGSGGGTYLWNPGNQSGASISVSPSQSITYMLSVTNLNGCEAQASVNITVNQLPAFNPMNDKSICLGGSVVLDINAQANLSYVWSPGGPGTNLLTVSPASTSSYSVVLTNAAGCTNSDTVEVVVNPLPLVQANSTDALCFGSYDGTASAQASAGTAPYSYWWSGGGGSAAGISGLAAGNYSVLVTDNNGCTASTSVTINQPTALLVQSSSSDALCFGANDGIASVSATGGIQPYTYLWNSGGQTTSTITGLPAGTYNVVVSDSNACSQTLNLNINQPTALSIASSVVPVQCFGMSNGSASVVAAGGTPTYAYQWSTGNSSTNNLSGLSAGNYTVIVTDANGCTSTSTAQITQPAILEIVSSSTPAACSAINNGTATVIVSGGSGGNTYLWSPGNASTASATGLSSGNYSVVVTDINGCTVSTNVVVGSIGGPLIAPGAVTDVACNGANTGSAAISVSAGTAPYSISWTPSGGTNAQATNLSAGNYTVNVTDNNGCLSSHQFSISEPSPLINVISNTNVSCFGGSNGTASIVAGGGTPGYTYQWSGSGGTNSTAIGLIAGTYSVTVTDGNGCTKISNVTVSQPSAINLTTSSSPAQCFGSSNGTTSVTAIGGSPGYSYNWSNATGTVDNLSGLPAGNYSVTVTDANSCTATASVSVTQPSAIQLSTSSTPASCSAIGNGSASVVASGGMAGFSYSWSPFGGNNSTANSLTPGQYTSIVTDANGCTSTAIVNVASIGGPVISPLAQSNVSCYGGNNGSGAINVNAGTPPYTIAWSPSGGAAMQATNLSAGTYSVRVTDNSGCIATHQVIITQPSLLNSGISKTDVACYGMSTGSASVNVSGGTLPFTYNWNPGGLGSETASNLSAGNYSVLITDANGCTNSVSTTIVQPSALVPVISSSQLKCHGDMNGAASVVVTGGVPAYNYSWSPGNASTANLNGLGSGNYSVSITDAQGCVIVASTSITAPAPMNLNLSGSTTICIGQSAQISAIVSGGTSPYNYLWNTGETDSSHLVSPLVTTSYSVQVVDSNGCSISALPIPVNVHPPLSVVAADLSIICEGDIAHISSIASGGNGGPYTYSWNNGSIIGSTGTISPVGDSTFVVTVTDGCGTPAAKDSVSIIVHPLPQVAFLPQSIEGCTPVNALFTNHSVAATGSSYLWNLGDNTTSTQAEPAHEYIVPGVYDVSLTIVSPEGCTAKLLVPQAVKVYGYPEAAFSQSSPEITVLNPGISFYDESINADYWEWDFGDGTDPSYESNPVHEYPDSGTYTVRLIVHSPGGCADTIYSTVRVEMEFIINVPNAFSPNGDGVNDGFIAKGIGYTDYSMWILDRWGRKIYHSTDRAIAWDGTYFGNGNQCQADVYEWVLDVVDFRGKKHRLIGHVTLFR